MLDLSRDYLAWDNVEAATLEVATRAAPRVVALPVAKRRAIRGNQKSPSGGVYVGYELRWLVPRATLPAGVEPKPADVLEDASGERWTVLTAERNKLNQTVVLGCVNLTLALDLRDTVTVERAALTWDAAGAPVKSFPPAGGQALYTLPARVQDMRRDIADERGTRSARRHYEVTLGQQVLDLDVSQDRLKWVDTTGVTRYLDLVEVRHSDEIDFLPVLDAEERL